MKNYSVDELRESFLTFFEKKGHFILPSAPLIPINDDSLLLINSGMAPLKTYFTGQEIPPSQKMVTCQKCIRTDDIENVNRTDRHGSMFEMLGNFSFADYFKVEAIEMAWEFLIETLEIPYEDLYVSVYLEDDETYDLWKNHMDLPAEKIFKLGKEDNFWEVGVGPCGPSSEIYVDRGAELGCGKATCAPGCDCDRFMEIWNLVFTQFYKEEDGSYSDLSQKNIDTGMGLERLAMVMQKVPSFFDIDNMMGIRDHVARLGNYTYGTDPTKDISLRVITDHIRAVTFLIGDGVLPANEGRGYVLRRLLRRAIRHGKQLNIQGDFLQRLAKTVIEEFKYNYPELADKESYILNMLAIEEARFTATLDQGTILFSDIIKELDLLKENIFPGSEAFKLYDTFGFPIEMMIEMLDGKQISMDEKGFYAAMDKQKQQARDARETSTYMGTEDTIFAHLDPKIHSTFTGYNALEGEAKIHYLIKDNEEIKTATKNDLVAFIVEKTPFYPEAGGQAGDKGTLKTAAGNMLIHNTQQILGHKILHIGKIIEGSIHVGDMAVLQVDTKNRQETARNHSATHLLHKALKTILGDHVEQAGSLVSAERLRFDFTHFSPLSAGEIQAINAYVNDAILQDNKVVITETDLHTAREMGAMALFGEKYGEHVRVIQMGDSIELCGGTHVENTAKIGPFKIISESGIAAGIRRLECSTGLNTIAYYENMDIIQEKIALALKTTPEEILTRLEDQLNILRDLNKEVTVLKTSQSKDISSKLLGQKRTIHNIPFLATFVKDHDMDDLKTLGDQLKHNEKSLLIVLVGEKDDKLSLLVMLTDDLIAKNLHAGNLVKTLAPIAGGRGGGRENMAQGGLENKEKIDELLAASIKFLEARKP